MVKLIVVFVLVALGCGSEHHHFYPCAEGGAGGGGGGGEWADAPVFLACVSDPDCGACGACADGVCVAVEPRACRPRQGPCDVVEYCDGVSLSCPADAVQPYGALPHHPGVPGAWWCGRYACDGGGVDCPASCIGEDSCAPGFVCNDAGGCEVSP